MKALSALLMVGLLAGVAAAQFPLPPDNPAGGANPATDKPAAADDKGAGGKPTPLPGEPMCGFCKTTGRVTFNRDQQFALEDETGPTWKVDYCSTAYESDNMGLAWMPCPHCKTPSLQAIAQKEWDAHKAAGADWLKERRRTDKVVNAEKPLTYVQTTHFLIVWNTPRITTAQKKTYDAHAAAHLYAHRLEDFYARFQSMFGIKDSENMKNLHTLMLFEKHDEAWLAGPAYVMLQGVPTVRRAGGANADSVVVTWWDKSLYPKEADMWRHQLHNFTHQFTAIYYDMTWFKPGELGLSPPWLEDKYGWLDEGLAHWFEIDFDKQARTYCMRETDNESRWGGDDWKKNIFKAVSADDIPSFSDLSIKPSESLTAKENQFAWSWVDFLMHRDQAAMGKAIKACKQEHPTRDILKDVWGLTILDFQSSWKDWVIQTYAPQPPGKNGVQPPAK